MEEILLAEPEQAIHLVSALPLLIHFGINTLVTAIILKYFYYAKSKRRDYVFTFALISISIFLMIFLLGGVKLKIGFALGLFAIFGIIRYRTESMPVREMTYLFLIIAISVINALSNEIEYIDVAIVNALFIISIWVCESIRYNGHIQTKIIQYDRIELIKEGNQTLLIEDLKDRTGLDIIGVEIGTIDFLRDSSIIKVLYRTEKQQENTVNMMTKLPRENE